MNNVKKTAIIYFQFILLVASQIGYSQIIYTYAGNGSNNYSGDGGPANLAGIQKPVAVATDTNGNVYIADRNNRIRKVDPTGNISTIAGNGSVGFFGDNVPASSSIIYSPFGIVLDQIGNIYFSDQGNHRIRKINTAGIITTLAGTGTQGFSGDNGPSVSAQIDNPHEITVDPQGNIYFVDSGNGRIRKISTTGTITTYVGTGAGGFSGDGGLASLAQISYPHGMVFDNNGNLFFCDGGNFRIRQVDAFGIISTIAGTTTSGFSGDGGPAANAEFSVPDGLCMDQTGNLYVSDLFNFRIRKINTLGIITTIAGNGTYGFSGDNGPALLCQFNEAKGLAIDNNGNIYISDHGNNRVRYLCQSSCLTGEKEYSIDKKASVFPNPSNGTITVKLPDTDFGITSVNILNNLGELVFSKAITSSSESFETTLQKGFYFLAINSKVVGVEYQKIIIE